MRCSGAQMHACHHLRNHASRHILRLCELLLSARLLAAVYPRTCQLPLRMPMTRAPLPLRVCAMGKRGAPNAALACTAASPCRACGRPRSRMRRRSPAVPRARVHAWWTTSPLGVVGDCDGDSEPGRGLGRWGVRARINARPAAIYAINAQVAMQPRVTN